MRQEVRLLCGPLDRFVAEDRAVLRAGLGSTAWISVDDTSALHARAEGVTTQIGDARFTAFRTGTAKSRLNFLALLRAGHRDYVVDDTALAYMRTRALAGPFLAALATHPIRIFPDAVAWRAHPTALGFEAGAITHGSGADRHGGRTLGRDPASRPAARHGRRPHPEPVGGRTGPVSSGSAPTRFAGSMPSASSTR